MNGINVHAHKDTLNNFENVMNNLNFMNCGLAIFTVKPKKYSNFMENQANKIKKNKALLIAYTDLHTVQRAYGVRPST